METTSTLPNFLGLHDSDFQFIERYRVLLEAETGALAHDFYDYLLSHPVTAAVFRDFSHARLDALIQKQAEHISGLLASHLNKSWRESMRKLGALHHRLGIEPSWVAGAYILYWRHWQKVLQEQVPEADRNALRDALFRLLIGDLMVQLDGYARASRETDADRLALFDVLLGVLAVPQGAESPRPEALLQQICDALPRKSASVRLAGYVVSDAMGDVLTLECMAGLPLPTLQLPKTAGDPCWEALECGRTVIQSVEDPRAPEWIKDLHNRVEEIGIFPFGAEDLRGAILIGAREKGYFHRVGSDYFHAFAHLGEMVLLLRNQSLRDPLTGLPNRTLFLDRLEIAQAQTLRNERLLGVALLDLDGFKQVNDRLGHAAGDQLLQAVVQRLQGYLRAGDTLARMGGDEFGLILPGLNSVEDLETLCNRLLATIREPLDIQGEAISVSGSIGVTLYPLDDNDSRTLIQHADMALYAAKDAGRD
ncbi:MAG: diguanylate cyclase, partial [Acidithiobacillus ferrivorans]